MTGKAPDDFTTSNKKQLVIRVVDFKLIAGQLYNMGPDDILRWYVLPHEQGRILAKAHDGVAGGHYGGHANSIKILQDSLWWLTMQNNVVGYVKICNFFQRKGK